MSRTAFPPAALVFLAAWLILSGCLVALPAPTLTPVPTPPGWIIDWLDHPVCAPPCWGNIHPGVTSIDATRSIQQRYPDMSIETKRGTSIVEMVSLNLAMHDNLPIKLILARYGQPSHVRVYKCDPNSRCETHILFEPLGMVLDAYPENVGSQGRNVVNLSDATDIFRIIFLEPGLAGYFASFSWSADAPLMPWRGYGEYTSP